ncbi:hypothetical protein [Kitasatospora camelliae]|uniref:Alkylation response protein AidB-like acyl-CoA dehydrogenase n=1 Tax=Kitasatospora camelliae TaxID=3156397 RepID=A0AAU8K211_9ACTN
MTAADPALTAAEPGLTALHGLLARRGVDLPSAAGAEEALDEVWERHPFALAAAVTEQLHGVLPLLDAFPAAAEVVDGVRTGRLTATLGLFTPNALFSLAAPAVLGTEQDGRVLLHGRYRYATEGADLAVVGVLLDGETRLALVRHDAAGVRLRGAGRSAGWGWAELDGAVLDPAELSRPVDRSDGGPLTAALDRFAWAFSRRAVAWPARVVADLRRVLATTGEGVAALSTSQYLAHELSRLEIEVSLAAAAARLGPGFKAEAAGGRSALAVLLSCVDLLHRAARVAEDLATELGLEHSPADAADWPADALQAYFGGRRVVENELARRMGLVPEAVGG